MVRHTFGTRLARCSSCLSTPLQEHNENMTQKIRRREALAVIGAAGAALAFGCGGDTATPTGPSASTTPASTPTAGGATNSTCTVTPNETVGPYPSVTDLFRSDIREDRPGTPLALTMTVVNTSNGCSPVPGVNVEIWQCDAAGSYSQYGGQTARTYLRGIQTTNASGQVTFTTIYPGWYQGRATHIHVDVVRRGTSAKVTQIAFPEPANAAVYGTGVYAPRGANPTSNTRDGIFADSLSSELASISGDPATGMTATFQVGITA
jgi:protocatechuate 3,4-dioxygenase beta subunit